jgi:hypothetical protein
MGAFHESRQSTRQNYEERGLWCLAAALPLPNTTSIHHLEVTVHQVEMNTCELAFTGRLNEHTVSFLLKNKDFIPEPYCILSLIFR